MPPERRLPVHGGSAQGRPVILRGAAECGAPSRSRAGTRDDPAVPDRVGR